MARFNERIKKYREDRGLTKVAFALAVGVTPPAVTKWENGQTANLKRENIVKLCQFLKITSDELISGARPPAPPGGGRANVLSEPFESPYRSAPAYRFPAELEAACAALDARGRELVEMQIAVAIDTATRLFGTAQKPIRARTRPARNQATHP